MIQNATMTVVLKQDHVQYTDDGPKIKNPASESEDPENYIYVISPQNKNILSIIDQDDA